MEHVLTVVVLAVALFLSFLAWRFRQQAQELRTRYSGLVDVDSELAALNAKLQGARRQQADLEAEGARRCAELDAAFTAKTEAAKRQQEDFLAADDRRRAALNKEYEEARSIYIALNKEIALLEENMEDISFGLYKPHFEFNTSDEFKAALEKLRDQERAVIRDGTAVMCVSKWTVGNSEREGARMVKLYSKLSLRAFNGECEAALADVSWNNISRMEERIRKSFEAINKLGDVLHVFITDGYHRLKLDELWLKHELENKKYQEREEQRRIREQIREEEKAQREIEKAKEDAEREEERYQKALQQAREEAAQATGAQLAKLTEQISRFEAKLDEARKNKERAISRAQLTKSGFVYVISNIGSFGERVYKIGMTRRLEPMDRIYELGDASVPFPFDLHAMLYSDNAPELEGYLHQHFEERRINLVNRRREFYRDVELHEIEDLVRAKGLSAQFIQDPEAQEFRESVAIREQKQAIQPQREDATLPEKLFSVPTTA
jgi:hypothetical protein